MSARRAEADPGHPAWEAEHRSQCVPKRARPFSCLRVSRTPPPRSLGTRTFLAARDRAVRVLTTAVRDREGSIASFSALIERPAFSLHFPRSHAPAWECTWERCSASQAGCPREGADPSRSPGEFPNPWRNRQKNQAPRSSPCPLPGAWGAHVKICDLTQFTRH